MNRGPANDKCCHNHKDQTGDAAKVAVFLSRARQQADTTQSKKHERIADANDKDRSNKSKHEHTDLH